MGGVGRSGEEWGRMGEEEEEEGRRRGGGGEEGRRRGGDPGEPFAGRGNSHLLESEFPRTANSSPGYGGEGGGEEEGEGGRWTRRRRGGGD